jgi:hypothetical protein
MAEGVGFEPTRERNPLPVFKTGALSHSATLPSLAERFFVVPSACCRASASAALACRLRVTLAASTRRVEPVVAALLGGAKVDESGWMADLFQARNSPAYTAH